MYNSIYAIKNILCGSKKIFNDSCFLHTEFFVFIKGLKVKLKDYFDDLFLELKIHPKWFLMRKIGRFHLVRFFLSSNFSQAAVPDMLLDEQISQYLLLNETAQAMANQLEEFGLYQGLTLKPDIVERIIDYAEKSPCYANRNPEFGFYVHQKKLASKYINQEILRANFYNLESSCEVLNSLKLDPVLRKISALYFKTTPVHVNTSLWWSFPSEANFLQKSKSAQVFHCDLDDFRFLKFFFYLTDVDNNSGPHIYIRGSHTQKPLFRQLLRGRASEQWLQNHYGKESFVTICGPSGFGFVEDTYGHHMGSPPKSKRRLILQVQFATHDYGNLHDLIDPACLKQLPLE